MNIFSMLEHVISNVTLGCRIFSFDIYSKLIRKFNVGIFGGIRVQKWPIGCNIFILDETFSALSTL